MLPGTDRAVHRDVVGHGDERRGGLVAFSLDRGQRGPDMGMILARNVLAQAGADPLVVRMAGDHPVDAAGVIGVLVAERTHHGELVHLAGELRQVLAHPDAGHVAVDGLEFAADLGRGVGLHVEGVVVRGAAVQKNDQARLRLAEDCVARLLVAGGLGLALEQLGQRQAEQPQAARPQQVPPADALAGS